MAMDITRTAMAIIPTATDTATDMGRVTLVMAPATTAMATTAMATTAMATTAIVTTGIVSTPAVITPATALVTMLIDPALSVDQTLSASSNNLLVPVIIVAPSTE